MVKPQQENAGMLPTAAAEVTGRERIGELLVQRGLVSRDQVRVALREQKSRRRPLGRLLVALGFISEAALRDALGEALHETCIALGDLTPDPEAIARLPAAAARRYQVFPVAWRAAEGRLLLAMTNTRDLPALDQIAALLGGGVTIEPLRAGEEEILHAIERGYGSGLTLDELLTALEEGSAAPLHATEAGHPLVRLVDQLLADAVRERASDIHLEPEQGFVRIRYRIDGVLHTVRTLHQSHWSALAVRIKVMAGLDIAEMRAPQDGRFTATLYGRRVDFRVSTFPTLHGENLVLRVLDREKGILALDQLDLPPEAHRELAQIMARPDGLILVSGPTGSGKTTTLYALLHQLDRERLNIMTLEDPVEYPVPGLRQSTIGEASRLDFANGVRAILRQDPDVLLVGEIRDRDTAELALRAAMTGHQVYATVHAHAALGAIPRLLDLGVRAEILAGNVGGVIAQRLVRRLCTHCRAPVETDARVRQRLGGATTVWRAVGCQRCGGLGYRGRAAVIEVVPFDEELDELVARGATLRQLQSAARARGHASLTHAALERVRQGVTSLEEAARVVVLEGV